MILNNSKNSCAATQLSTAMTPRSSSLTSTDATCNTKHQQKIPTARRTTRQDLLSTTTTATTATHLRHKGCIENNAGHKNVFNRISSFFDLPMNGLLLFVAVAMSCCITNGKFVAYKNYYYLKLE